MIELAFTLMLLGTIAKFYALWKAKFPVTTKWTLGEYVVQCLGSGFVTVLLAMGMWL